MRFKMKTHVCKWGLILEEIQTNLCAVTEQRDSSVCGIDVDGLQLD